jgi:hypothetical protein
MLKGRAGKVASRNGIEPANAKVMAMHPWEWSFMAQSPDRNGIVQAIREARAQVVQRRQCIFR